MKCSNFMESWLIGLIGVLYSSVALPAEQGKAKLASAVRQLLSGSEDLHPSVLWSLDYHQRSVEQPSDSASKVLVLPNVPLDLGLPDSFFGQIKSAWQQITGDTEGFMSFEAREGMEDEE